LESASRIREFDGVILACPSDGSIPADLGMLGARSQTVAAWVRHALSHEHQHESHTH